MGLGPDIVAGVAARLSERIGLDLPAWVVDARASARIAALGMRPADYVALIESGRGERELDELVESVRVGETRLFRHRSQVQAIVDVVAPALRFKGKRAVRVWSAGCSTGEEPFTLAAVLAKALPGTSLSIIATDVSDDALANAVTATYPLACLQDIPEAYRDAFVVEDDVVRVRKDIAALVRFERANLVDGPAPKSCDIVWCRNVLIYFTPQARKRAVDKLIGAALPGGVLFVGYSESLREARELDPLRAGDAVYYVKREPEAGLREQTGVHSIEPRRPSAARPAPGEPPPSIAALQPKLEPKPVRRDVARTPPPMLVPRTPPPTDLLALRGRPDARSITAELSVRLGLPGLRELVVDFDGAELLGDDLVPVLRRARAAAAAAGVALTFRATRPGARRWLSRFELDDAGGAA